MKRKEKYVNQILERLGQGNMIINKILYMIISLEMALKGHGFYTELQ